MLSNKIQLIKSYDEQILDSINTDANIEREIFESSEFKKAVSELIISFNKIIENSNQYQETLQRFEVHAEHFGSILIAVLMKKKPHCLSLRSSYLETCLKGSGKLQNY